MMQKGSTATSRSHSDKKSITPSFMVPYTSPKQGMMSNKVCLTKADFFKGISKGLIPSDAIGVDFYIKKAEPHKKRRSHL